MAGIASRFQLSRGALGRAPCTGPHHFAGQRFTYDPLRHLRTVDERVESDSCLNPHLVAHVDKVLGTNISGCPFMARKRASAEASARAVELIYPEPKGRVAVGDASSAGVMQVETERQIRPALPDGTDASLDRRGRAMADRIRQVHAFELYAVFGSKR